MSQRQMNILVVGVVRNGAASLPRSFQTIARALAWNENTRFFIVESDSDDDTVVVLAGLRDRHPAVSYDSLGELRVSIPARVDRIAYCRNHYLERIRQNPEYADVDHVIVADLDGMNDALTPAALASCFERDDWDVCTANQDGPYYDIYALRHPIWCPQDWWIKANFFRDIGVGEDERVRAACHSQMVTIDPGADWIAVDSAFGGLAVYDAAMLRASDARYVGHDGGGGGVCEHVTLHQALRRDGARIFINPALINARYTEHTRQLVGKLELAYIAKSALRIARHHLLGRLRPRR